MKLGFALICVDACTFLTRLHFCLVSADNSRPVQTQSFAGRTSVRVHSEPPKLYPSLAIAVHWTDRGFLFLLTGSNYGRPNGVAQIASWNQAALEGFLRILVGCLFGAYILRYRIDRALPLPSALGPRRPELRHMSDLE